MMPAGESGRSELSRAWRSIALPGYRDIRGTYSRFDVSDIPAITRTFDGTFSWLRAAPDSPVSASIGGRDMGSELKAIAADRWSELPKPLRVFLRSPVLQAKIPSVTACWNNFGTRLEPAGMGGGTLLRVISDQQDCLHWFVRLLGPGRHDTVVSPFPYCDDLGDWTDEELALYDPVLEVCADSFEEFIWRFWIENSIWLALRGESPLTAEQERYLSFYKSASR